MTVRKVPPFSTPTNLPARDGKARRRKPLDPTVSNTLSINRSGLEAGACDEVELVCVEVEDVGVDEELDVDDEGVEVDEVSGVDAEEVPGVEDVEDVVEVLADEEPGTCCTHHAATYP